MVDRTIGRDVEERRKGPAPGQFHAHPHTPAAMSQSACDAQSTLSVLQEPAQSGACLDTPLPPVNRV